MRCTCSHLMVVDAPDQVTAAGMMKMTQEQLDAHWAEKHAGDPNKPSLDQANAVVDGAVHEATPEEVAEAGGQGMGQEQTMGGEQGIGGEPTQPASENGGQPSDGGDQQNQ